MRNPGDGGESQPTAKNLLIFPNGKMLFNKFTSNNPIQASFVASFVVIAVVLFLFNFRLYVHTCHANFD